MLQLKRLGLYFERIVNKNGYFHVEIMISAADMLGGSMACSPNKCTNVEMIEAIWCVLMYILIRFLIKKEPLFNIKKMRFKKKHAVIDE